MADRQAIIEAIDKHITSSEKPKYSSWTIGITHSPNSRRKGHDSTGKDTTYWAEWEAYSLTDAQYIESYFKDKNVCGDRSKDLTAMPTNFVYVF